MAPNDIREKLDRQPFRPLRVYLSDGSVHLITEREMTYLSRMEFAIGLDPDESGLPTRTIYIDPRHVTRIEPQPNGPDVAPRSNGDRR